MAWTERRAGWTTQPQGPVSASAAWRSRGLVALFDTRRAVELVNGNYALSKDTVGRSSVAGLTADFGTTAAQTYGHRASYATTGAMTIIAFCDISSIANYTIFIAKQASTTTYCPYEFSLGVSGPSAGDPLFLRCDASTYGLVYAFSPVATAGNAQLISLRTPSANAIDTAAVFGVGKTFGALTNTAGSSVSAADNGSTVIIGGRSDGTVKHFDGRLYYVALFNRYLSESEVVALVRNPWALYAPRRARAFRESVATTVPARYYFDMLAGRGNLWG